MQVYIATFVVSGYASSHCRTGGKPFNPVLGETYECDRPDKGFRFVAEQVRILMPALSTVVHNILNIDSPTQLFTSSYIVRSAITRRSQPAMQSLKTSSSGKVVKYGNLLDPLSASVAGCPR